MALRVFPDLCMRARKAGAQRLVFTSELDSLEGTPDGGAVGASEAWSVTAFGRVASEPLARCYGRTGEEALRLVVEKLEAPL